MIRRDSRWVGRNVFFHSDGSSDYARTHENRKARIAGFRGNVEHGVPWVMVQWFKPDNITLDPGVDTVSGRNLWAG